MVFLRTAKVPLVMGTVCTVASALRMKRANTLEAGVTSYSFNAFIEDFGRTYTFGTAEYLHRSAVFESSLAQIFATNSREDQSWTAGVYPFMDLTFDERQSLHGYKPSGGHKSGIVALEMNTTVYGGSGDSYEAAAPPVLNQGSLCGSCWAVSAIQAVEAQLMKTDTPTREHLYGSPMRLSSQALLECAQIENPHNCGGPGGCKGATSEVAFDYIRDHGIPLSSDHPYHPTHLSKKCTLEPYPANWARVTIGDWKTLPSNKAQSLMQALVEDGAVVVAIDSHNLYPYSSGIFDDCPKDAVVSHALLAKGYGEAAGQKYWSLQNSWGLQWGESGSVRVLRRDNEDQWCGTDHHPEEGFACDGETKPVTVCGTCGILFDMVIPSSPRVEAPQQTGSDPSDPVTQPDSDMSGPAAGAHVADQSHEFSAWGMRPPSAVDVVSATSQVDSYLSTPAPYVSISSNQVRTTASPATDMQSPAPDTSAELAGEEFGEQHGASAPSSDISISAPQAILAPSSAPTDSQPSSVSAPAFQPVVVGSPTSDVAKMQQLLKQHDMAPEATDAPPDEEPAQQQLLPKVANVPSAEDPTKANVPTEHVAKMQQLLKQHEALPDGADDEPPSAQEALWDQLPESMPGVDASHAMPVVASEEHGSWANTPASHQQALTKMPVPETFSESVNQFNAQTTSLDGVNAAVDVGTVTPVPAAEVPPPEILHSEFQPVEEASEPAEVTMWYSSDAVTATPPPDVSSTAKDGMKRLFSQYKFA